MAGGLFSTKGRYALRAMGDLATHEGWVSLGDVSRRQHISRKYLEQVIALMHKAGYVESMRGKGGGYRLSRKPEEYSVGEILTVTEGTLAVVACLSESAEHCPRAEGCATLPMWSELNQMIHDFFYSKKLTDLVEQK